MKHATLGQTELSVSRLGFGAAPIGFLDVPQEQVNELVAYLIDHGINTIDTAAGYRESESKLGRALSGHLSGHRDEVVLISKCGQMPGSPDWAPQTITASVDQSLEKLGTDHLDVLLLHSCPLEVLRSGEAIGAMLDAKKAGKTRFIGFSGDNEEAAFAADQDPIEVLELSLNIADQLNADRVLTKARERDLGVIVKRPLANAAWNPLDHQRGLYRDYAQVYHDRIEKMGITPSDLGYSGHVEVEWPEIALKFALSFEGVHTAIVGTTSIENSEANIESVEKNPLRSQVVKKLREAFAKAQAKHGETWAGQT